MSIRSSAQIAACAVVGLAISQAALAAPVPNGDIHARDEVATAKLFIPPQFGPGPVVNRGGSFATFIERAEGPLGPGVPDVGILPSGFEIGPGPVLPRTVAARFSGPLGPDIPDLGPGPGLHLTPGFSLVGRAPAPTDPASVLRRFSGPLGPDIPVFPSGFRLGPGIELPPSSVASAASTPDPTVVPRLLGPIGPVIPNLGPGIELPLDHPFGLGPAKAPGSTPTPTPTAVARDLGPIGPVVPDFPGHAGFGPGFGPGPVILPTARDLGPIGPVIPDFPGEVPPPAITLPTLPPRAYYDDLD